MPKRMSRRKLCHGHITNMAGIPKKHKQEDFVLGGSTIRK